MQRSEHNDALNTLRWKSILGYPWLLGFAFLLLVVQQVHSSDHEAEVEILGRCSLSADFHLQDGNAMPIGNMPPGIVVVERSYPEHRALEWQLRISAPETEESPLYQELVSADFLLELPDNSETQLHWSQGSHASPDDFEPKTQPLARDATTFRLESIGGRSSDGCMPYFNLAQNGGGAIVAIGWAGDWKCSFEMVSDRLIRITAGLKRTHLKLQAGQTVRLPSILLMSYQGDWIEGQNQFRKLMLHQFTPKNHAPMELMPVAASIHGVVGFNDTTEANVLEFSKAIQDSQLPLDTLWLDAGWTTGGFPAGQGNPDADTKRFPLGLKPIGDQIQQHRKRFLVWFEPERAMRGTWMERERPDWILKPSLTPDEYRYMENDGFHLVDFGKAEVRKWALDAVSKHITEASIDIYRQDFNEYPSYFWHTQEKPDAIGLREILYVNGLYDFWDELLQRHPDLVIDSCASGGRRLDFETMRRSVCLWRSDSCWDDKAYPRNVQAMQYGLSLWSPLHGLGSVATDSVSLRSGMGACASYAIQYRDPNAIAALQQFLPNYLGVRHLFAKDFYPLTAWSKDANKWIAFQYHDPEQHEGLVLAFCATGKESLVPSALRGIDLEREYTVRNWDQPQSETVQKGHQLVRAGVVIKPNETAQAIVLHYQSKSKQLSP